MSNVPVYKVFCMYVFVLLSYRSLHVICAEVCFVVFHKKKQDVYTNMTMPIFCALPNSITSSSFICWSIPVSEIRELNGKKKKKKEKYIMEDEQFKKWLFRFDTFPTVQMNSFFSKLSF